MCCSRIKLRFQRGRKTPCHAAKVKLSSQTALTADMPCRDRVLPQGGHSKYCVLPILVCITNVKLSHKIRNCQVVQWFAVTAEPYAFNISQISQSRDTPRWRSVYRLFIYKKNGANEFCRRPTVDPPIPIKKYNCEPKIRAATQSFAD